MRLALGCLLVLCACPSAKKKEGPLVDLSKGALQLAYRVDSPTASMDEVLRVARARLEAARQPAVVLVNQRRLLVQVPPTTPEAVEAMKHLLSTPSHLEFREVDDGAWLAELEGKEPEGLKVKSGAGGGLERRLVVSKGATAPTPPQGLAWVQGEPDSQGQVEYTPVKPASLDNAAIKSAEAEPGMTGNWQVSIAFTPEGAKALEEVTTRLVHHCLAIVLDGKLLMAPQVQEPIRGGRAMVTLGHAASPQKAESQARSLAIGLQSGALPAALVAEEERLLPPTTR